MDVSSLMDEFRKKYPPLIIATEAATIARRPLQTIYDWSSRGLLDGMKSKVGRQLLFDRDAFIRFLAEGGMNTN